jgi:GH43 family beta-xylosidase
MRNNNNFNLFTCLLFIAVSSNSFISCKKKDENIQPVITTNPADSIKAYPGMNRIKLTWLVNDTSVKKAIVYWDNSDSAVVAINERSAMMSLTINDLQEGNHSFSIYLYDAEGHSSSRSKIVAPVYGDRYIESLTSQPVNDALFYDGQVKITWGQPFQSVVGRQISYTNSADSTALITEWSVTDTTILKNYRAGTFFKYRSMYVPVPDAIDTFYSAYISSDENNTFTNPLLPAGADPWVVYKDGRYYYTHTSGGSIELSATNKMSDLGKATEITVWRPPANTEYSKEIWAPEMYFLDNKWYIYFAADDGNNVNHRMYVIENSSADPLSGQWEFKGKLEEPSDEWAIDGTILEYNQQRYMLWSGSAGGKAPQNIYIAKMSNPYTLEGSRVMISSPSYSWEKNGAAINEGPEILKNKNGNNFLIYSASGFWTDDYCLGMMSLKDGGDPLNASDWVKSTQPVLTKNAESGAFGPGHCSFFKSADGTEDWIIYHARSLPDGGSTNYRNPRIQKFTWSVDGTPYFGEPVKIDTKIKTPSGEF